ncbi:hypothetical protein SC499_21645 [Peribacillus simplex]|uniref:hypothetical protein n=1 Tax=Peribacillus simplex TaxID=1478 RepID=UPI00298EABB4|nr:hypothetical protein [Peribacillus simplex]MDW7617210.1 hypothetical protein [Peribacillus simplex]
MHRINQQVDLGGNWMTYLKQFVRNRRRREKTEVLTALISESLYGDFKGTEFI